MTTTLFLSCCLLTALSTVLRTALLTVCNALGIKCTTDDVITYTRKVTYSTSSDKNNRVFLKVVADTGNVADCFETVGKLNLCNFTESGVRFFRCGGVDLGAYASLLGSAKVCLGLSERVETFLECRRFRLVVLLITAVTNELVECWNVWTSFLTD